MPADGPHQDDLSDFDPVWYLQTYADVRESGMDPWDHYEKMGRGEGRQAGPVQALDLDHMLWRGFEDEALPALRALLAGDRPRECAVAGWALARWERDRGNADAARAAILAFHRHPEGRQAVGHPGPYLLGVQLCLEGGDVAGAERIMREGIARFGPLPDFELARFQCGSARRFDDWELSVHLARIYLRRGLTPVGLATGEGTRFDRLEAETWEARPVQDPPLVSVIVPVFNGARGLGKALAGLRAQSWRNLEILVVDDGSTDGSAAIAGAAAAKDPRVRLIRLERNQGAYPARNRGMAEARGAFLTVHDADDWSHPSKIHAQMQPLLREPGLKASVSHWVRAGNDLEMTRWRMEEAWIYRNVSSLLIRAELRDTLGYWDRVRVNSDTEYYYRIIAAFGPESIHEVHPGVPLAFGRTDPGSLTMQSATHLRSQFGGLRRDYMEAAHYWHGQAVRQGIAALHLPEHPAQRPFRVPPQIGLGDPEGPPSAFDIVSDSGKFDPDWYRLGNPDVLRADVSPARHYVEGGARENRDPGPLFSSGGYRLAQRLEPETVPLLHWEESGGAAPALPSFPGALADTPAEVPRRLVFAHSSGKTLFGAERSLLAVVERMARRGQCPVVVLPVLRNPDYLERLLPITAAVEVLPQMWRHRLRPPHPQTLEACRALIRRHRAAEVHVNTVVLDAPLLAARAEGCPSVVHVRELPAEDAALCRQLGMEPGQLHRELLAQADRFIANSEPVARWLGCPERVQIRPNSVDEALFGLPYAPGETFRVGLISSNIAKKGVADFLAVARIVEQSGRPVRFVLIGPPSHDLHLLRPWPGNVDFAGYAASPAEAVGQVDLVMSLSKFAESFGRTVMEAMAAGRPVVCYDRGAPPTLVQSGRSGFVVPADSRQAAANAVLALEIARGQLLKMSDAARVRARELQDLALLT